MGFPLEENGDGDANAKIGLVAALERIDAQGSHGGFSMLDRVGAAEPGIGVKGLGNVNLPLVDGLLPALLETANPVPWDCDQEPWTSAGAGRQTTTSVWELLPDQVCFGNEKWNGFVDGICERAARGLGITAFVPELSKLFIIGPDMAPTTRMYAEEDGRFATLVVNLAAFQPNGEVAVVFCETHKIMHVFGTDTHFATCYSGICHVPPNGPGPYFLATYSLSCPPPNALPQVSPPPSVQHQVLRQALWEWIDDSVSQAEKSLYYELENHYPGKGGISLGRLQGNDAARVKALVGSSTEIPFDLFLSRLEKREWRENQYEGDYDRYLPDGSYERYNKDGTYERYYEDGSFECYDTEGFCLEFYSCRPAESRQEEHQHGGGSCDHSSGNIGAIAGPGSLPLGAILRTEYVAKPFTDLGGEVVKRELGHDVDTIPWDGFLRWVESTDVDDGESPISISCYTTTALVIVPLDSILDTLGVPTARASDDECIIRYLAERWQRSPDKEQAFELLRTACDSIWMRRPILPREACNLFLREAIIQKVLRIAAWHEEWAFFDGFLGEVYCGNIPPQALGLLRVRLARDGVDLDGNSCYFGTRLDGYVFPFTSLSEGLEAVQRLAPLRTWIPTSSRPAELEGLRLWAREMMRYCFIACDGRFLTRRDAINTFELLMKYCDIPELTTRIVPFISYNMSQLAFSLTCLARLYKHTWEGRYPEASGFELYKKLAHAFVQNLDIAAIHGINYAAEEIQTRRHYDSTLDSFDPRLLAKMDPNAVDHADLVDLVVRLVALNMKDALRLFSTAIARGIKNVLPQVFASLWLPFLRLLRDRQGEDVALATRYSYRSIFSIILRGYVTRYVGKQVVRQHTFTAEQLSCSCEDCGHVSRFLLDPTQKVYRELRNSQRRKHINWVLNRHQVGCDRRTDNTTSPYTIILTKKYGNNADAVRAWEQRRLTAERELSTLDGRTLLALLGPAYREIMEMRWVLSTASTPAPAPVPVPVPILPTLTREDILSEMQGSCVHKSIYRSDQLGSASNPIVICSQEAKPDLVLPTPADSRCPSSPDDAAFPRDADTRDQERPPKRPRPDTILSSPPGSPGDETYVGGQWNELEEPSSDQEPEWQPRESLPSRAVGEHYEEGDLRMGACEEQIGLDSTNQHQDDAEDVLLMWSSQWVDLVKEATTESPGGGRKRRFSEMATSRLTD